MKQTSSMKVRNDPAGSGEWHAPRGSRKHRGIDFVCTPGEGVLSPVNGRVTKNGYCYADDLQWRYVEITDDEGRRHRLFYVDPIFNVGKKVTTDTVVGRQQNIADRYPGQRMKPHVHYEIISKAGRYLNPEKLA